MSKALRFLQITPKHPGFPFFFPYFNDENFIPKYREGSYRFRFNFTYIEATIRGKISRERFCKNSSQ